MSDKDDPFGMTLKQLLGLPGNIKISTVNSDSRHSDIQDFLSSVSTWFQPSHPAFATSFSFLLALSFSTFTFLSLSWRFIKLKISAMDQTARQRSTSFAFVIFSFKILATSNKWSWVDPILPWKLRDFFISFQALPDWISPTELSDLYIESPWIPFSASPSHDETSLEKNVACTWDSRNMQF